MKNFIITTGAVILILTMMSCHIQCCRVLRTKELLKVSADEAAATAGVCFDPRAYGEGVLQFDEEKARSRAAQMIELNLKKAGIEPQWNLYFSGSAERPAVTVEVSYEQMTARGSYEYVPLVAGSGDL